MQPVDPLELWTTPPFEPTVQREGKGQGYFTGRGVSDDKGGLLQPIQVVFGNHGDFLHIHVRLEHSATNIAMED